LTRAFAAMAAEIVGVPAARSKRRLRLKRI